ncbi:adenylate cyclase class 2 [Halorubrum alkaliphilum]|uniref:Adenylate cyclase class 2 n=1 Tax=Halorubrum alkaliphilum TaxID=261290 RepID=A0A8T4GB24_9EURY|nr:class IV adenylate cyclase [Halorubrum alkaliphilum]MBP1921614.1 adenylate cyclase class 2 [Halorubrum alkaliphilum]
MYEVEIKVPAAHDAVRARLTNGDARPGETRWQRDVYYDAPHREFAETDEALRIRHETTRNGGEASGDEETESTRITYKGPLLDEGSKTRSEHETGVDDADEAAGILDGLGFEPTATVEKRREYWSFEGFTVSLDAVDGLGEFVEIEREVETEDAIAPARDSAVDALERLGLDAADQIRTSYLGLLLADE